MYINIIQLPTTSDCFPRLCFERHDKLPLEKQLQGPYVSFFSFVVLLSPWHISISFPLTNLFPATLSCPFYGTFLSTTSSPMMREIHVNHLLLFRESFPHLFLCFLFRDACPSLVSFCILPTLTSYHSSHNPPTTFISGIFALFNVLQKLVTRESSVAI